MRKISEVISELNQLQIRRVTEKERRGTTGDRWCIVYRKLTNQETNSLTYWESQALYYRPKLFKEKYPPKKINCKHCGCPVGILQPSNKKKFALETICACCGRICNSAYYNYAEAKDIPLLHRRN